MAEMVGPGRIIVPNKAAPLAITSDTEPALFVLNFASVQQGRMFSAGVLGHYFVFGEEPYISSGGPLLTKFKDDSGDRVIMAVKLASNGAPWFYGVTVEKLIEFADKPPARKDKLQEAAWLQSWKASDEAMQSDMVPW